MKSIQLSLFILLGGCVFEAPLTNAPCPCLAGQTCCELTGLCVAEGFECPVFPDFSTVDQDVQDVDARPVDMPMDARIVDAAPMTDATPPPDARTGQRALRVEPAHGSHRGGTRIQLTIDPPLNAEAIRVGGRPCVDLTAAAGGWQCTTPPSDTVISRADIVVTGDSETIAIAEGFHYILPPFSDVTTLSGVELPDPLMARNEGHSIVPLMTDDGLEILFAGVRGPTWLRQDGPLHFARGAPAWLGEMPATFKAGAFDANGDRRPDVFIARRDGDPLEALVTLHLANDTAFEAPIELSRANGRVPAPALVPFDVDADGDLDLVGALSGNAQQLFGWFRNDGDGAFVLTRIANFDPQRAAAGADIIDVELVDFDRDGHIDLFACGDQLWFLRGTPDGFEEQSAAIALPALSLPCGDLEIADLDADGWFDLIVVPETGRDGRQPRVTGIAAFFNVRGERVQTRGPYQNDEPNPRCPGTHYMHHMVRLGAGSLLVLDVDLDGDLDLMLPQSSHTCPGAMSLYRATLDPDKLSYIGESVVTSHHTSASGGLAYDFDGDGDLDVLSHGYVFHEGPRLLRNNAIENALPEAPARWLTIQATRNGQYWPGTWIEIDLDGPADAPDWTAGVGKLRMINLTDSAMDGHRGGIRSVGLGGAEPPYHVRAHYPGAEPHVVRVDAANQAMVVDPALD